MDKQHVKFYQTTWTEIADEVKVVNNELYNIINDLNPGKELRLYVGEYPFGHNIVKSGKFYIPVNNRLYPIDAPEIPKKIQQDLIYNMKTNPVSLILNKNLELCLGKPVVDDFMTSMIISKGNLFSTSAMVAEKILHPPFLWNITSGARSIFMLPKISEARMYRKLCSNFNIDIEPPSNSYDHWQIFKKISLTQQKNLWLSKILYFSENWFKQLDDPDWIYFKNYLYKTFNYSYNYMGNIFMWDYIFNLILKDRKIKPSIYVNNIAKHLFYIGIGFLCGMAPAIDESMAPIKYLQSAFIENYQLKSYLPTIMQPTKFIMGKNSRPVYYSLQIPSLLDTPKKRDNSSHISDLYDIFSLYNKYRSALLEEKYNVRETEFIRFLKTTEVNALHTHPERYSLIHKPEKIFQIDSSFNKSLYSTKNDKIAIHSSFFRGCFSFLPI